MMHRMSGVKDSGQFTSCMICRDSKPGILRRRALRSGARTQDNKETKCHSLQSQHISAASGGNCFHVLIQSQEKWFIYLLVSHYSKWITQHTIKAAILIQTKSPVLISTLQEHRSVLLGEAIGTDIKIYSEEYEQANV